MNGPADDIQQKQSLFHSHHDYTACYSDSFGAGSTSSLTDSSSSPQIQMPHLGPNPVTNNDSVNSSIDLALLDNVILPTEPETTDGLAQAVEHAPAGDIEQPDSAVGLVDQISVKDGAEVLLEHVNGQIELLEDPSGGGVPSGESSLIVEESQEWIPDPDHELKRVKVYELIGQRWVDQGTAFCFGQFSEERNEAFLVARSERNHNDIILTTTIRSNDVYQRQQDTLIVWTEPDGVDYALSFQDPEGCAEVWNFILEVQQHLNTSDDQTNVSSPLLGSDTSVTAQVIINSGHLPSPQLGIISEIERAIKQLARTQPIRERICEYIQHEEYIKSLIEVMHTAEDLESLENLHALCSLMQTILMLNDHSMYEHILEDDIFFGVVGMLEYDPDFPGHKANYRDFLHNTAQFHQPIPMRDIAVQRKVHHTYRLQFLKDVVLARALDDSTFNVLSSCIIFNQIDIISHLQQDQTFLSDIVKLFINDDGDAKKANSQEQPQMLSQEPTELLITDSSSGDDSKPEVTAMDVDQQQTGSVIPKLTNGASVVVNGNVRLSRAPPGSFLFCPPDGLTEEEMNLRREVIMLLQQLSVMGKNVQMPARLALFRTLVDRGILLAVQWALGLPERDDTNKQMINAAGEVLSAMLDHDLNGVRGHVLKQVFAVGKVRVAGKRSIGKAETILDMACRIMAQSKDLSVQSQMGDALRSWLEVPTGDLPAGPAGSEAVGPKPLLIRKDEPTTERFMDYFYKDCINILLKPLTELPEWKNFKEPLYPLTREETNRFVYLCDLLYTFVQQHQFRSHFHIMASDILARIATLFKAKDKHLRHAAFRIFRLLLKQNNPNSHVQILKYDILKPILDLTIKESLRDNLLSCSCQEYFEIMRKENMKDLIKWCIVKHEAEIQELSKSLLGGELFQRIIQRHEMNIAPRLEEPAPKPSEDERWPSRERTLDREEEDYFNTDDDSELVPSISQKNWILASGATSPLLANNTGMKRKRKTVVGAATKGYRPPLKAPHLGDLVDYSEDEDEESTSASEAASSIPLTVLSSIPTPSTPSASIPSTPATSGPPLKRLPKDDENEDNFLEALARNTRSRPQSHSLKPVGAKLGEKRRREEDEQDEQFVRRLSKPNKKPDLGAQKDSSSVGRRRAGEDAKKIKVKLGAIGLSVASTPSSPATTSITESHPSSQQLGTKDGDTG